MSVQRRYRFKALAPKTLYEIVRITQINFTHSITSVNSVILPQQTTRQEETFYLVPKAVYGLSLHVLTDEGGVIRDCSDLNLEAFPQVGDR